MNRIYDEWTVVLFVAIILPSAILFWLLIRKEKTRIERREQNRCSICGYDLRASRERCPECGTVIGSDVVAEEVDLDPRALSSNWPDNPTLPRVPLANEISIVIHRTFNQTNADLLRRQLQARGINAICHQKEMFEGLKWPKSSFAFAIIVPSGDLELARETVKQFHKKPSAELRI